jgi:aminopeptidase N
MLAGTCRDLLDRAAPGSGVQLVAARGLAECALAPADLATLRGWLAGENVPEGLSVDPELRWTALLRLVVTGLVGVSEIDAELARDRNDEGQRWALRCRAALPDPEAKARTWHSVSTDTSLSPYVVRAMLQGFWQPEQADLLADYLPRYFTELPDIAVRRDSAEMDRVLGLSGFPGYAVTADVVTLAGRLLTDVRLGPGLARHVSDQLDETRRALRVRRAEPRALDTGRRVTAPADRLPGTADRS